ncbi:MAG: ABC transporter substrate-binding protein [Promethearchaeota archaeon]
MSLKYYCLFLLIFAFPMIIAGCSDSDEEKKETDPNSKTVVKLGAILPETGDLAKYGKTSRAAIELAIKEINNKQGDTKFCFECVFEDDAMSPAKGVSAAQKLITVDKVAAIIGPMGSTVTQAVAPIVERAGIVLLSPGSTEPGITDIGQFIFRNCLSDKYEGSEMSSFVFNDLGLKKVGVYHINNAFGIGISEVFINNFRDKGGEIVLVEAFMEKNRDHRTALMKFKAIKPEGIYLIGYDEMVSVFRQGKELGFKTQWLATSFLNDQYLVDRMGNDADGTVLAAWVYDPNSPDPRIQKFAEVVRKQTGGLVPDVFSANSYDAIYLIYQAICVEGSTPSEIRKGLLSIKNYMGVTGETTFEKNGDVRKKLEFKKIKNRKLQPL